jgi:hypothetical protein
MKIELSLPDNYDRPHKCGCGADSARIDLVPDSILLVSVRDACCPHDFEYTVGGTQKDKTRADRRFLANMLKIINSQPWYYPKEIAKGIAFSYYYAVRLEGDKHFNFTQEKPDEAV